MQTTPTSGISHDADKWDLIHRKIHKDSNSHSFYIQEKEALFRRGSVVCDLGGGTGGDALYLLSKGHSVILMDISSFALKVSQNRAQKSGLASKLVVKQIDFGLHTLPLKDASIDVFYSRISLNYFGHKHTARILHDIYRSLRPGGVAYLTFKSPDDLMEMSRLHKLAVLYEPGVFIEAGHLRSRFTIEQLQQICVNAGISHATVRAFPEPLGKDQFGRTQILHQNEVVFSKAQDQAPVN